MWPEPVPTTNSMLPSNPPSAKTVRPGCRHVRNKWTFLVYKEHLRDACSLEEKLWQKQRHHFADKGPDSQSYDFSSSHEWMWVLDHKEGWALKNWCFQTVVLEKTLESHLDSKEMKPVNPKGNHPWIFIGRTDTEAEAPIFWPPDARRQFIAKDPDAGKDWGQEEKKETEDEMVEWHHWLNGHESEQTPGDSEEQGSL